jgi:hypothetical protein
LWQEKANPIAAQAQKKYIEKDRYYIDKRRY